MKRNHVFKIAFALTLTSFFSLFVTGVTFSWFIKDNKIAFDGEIGTTQANYYESGDGSESTPFIISNPRHLYNLAWLQYLGTYNQVDTTTGKVPTYYFEIKNDIDMKGYVLPPIGTESNPFLSNFNANNCTISNLTISNVIDDDYIETYPSVVIKKDFNSQKAIVGFFGVIGTYNSSDSTITYDTSKNEVKNLYLDNLTITSKKDNLLIGVFAGYVNGTIDNCGVHYVKMNIKGATTKLDSFDNVSKFTLIGDYNKNSYSYDQDGSGSGEDYGTSTDIRDMYEKLKVYSTYMSGTTMTIPKVNAIPFNFDSSSSIITGSGTKTITTSGKQIENVSYASTLPVSSNGSNIGYYSGGEIKVYEDYFNSDQVDFDKMKTAGNSKIYVDDDNEHIDKIKTYLKTTVSSSSTYRMGDTAMVLSGTYFGDGSSSTSFPSSKDNYLVVKDAKVGSWSGDLFIPARGIWVAPTKPGRFEFVGINIKNSGSLTNASISIIRLKRSTPKDYSTGFSNVSYTQGTDFTNDMCGCTIYGGSNAYVPYYFGVDVTQEDIDNGYEFFITKYASDMLANPYIIYIDVGTNGGSSEDTKKELGQFDFVTKDSNNKLTKIKTKNSDNTYSDNSDYSKSNVTFKIGDTTGDTTLAFRRIDQDTNGVLYYQSVDSILTPSGTGKNNEASDDNCNSKKS